jgi:hypothetical protein
LKTTPRYIVTLKFLNAILKNSGKDEIDDILNFVIDKENLIKKENDVIIDNMVDEIFKKGNYKKLACGFFRRKTLNNYVLTLLRYMCLEFGYGIKYETKHTHVNNVINTSSTYKIIKNEIVVKKVVNENQIGKNSDKYKVALKFINQILKNLNKTEITDLTEFKGISRLDIIKEENVKSMEDMYDEIFAKNAFDKKFLGYHRKKVIKNYILTVLRYMCIDLGLKIVITDKTIQRDLISKKYVMYTISA